MGYVDRPHRNHRIMKCVKTFLQTLHPKSPFEIRVLGIGDKKWTKFGYYRDHDKAAKDIAEIEKQRPTGVYVTVNPVSPDVMGRSHEKLSSGRSTTQDGEITSRKWLYLDIDAGQPSGVNASEEERQNAYGLMKHVSDTMRTHGWFEAIQGSSGNGMYLMYEIDLPNDEDSTKLLSGVYLRIAELTKTDKFGSAKVDTTVYNASRIMRVLGTWNRKGDEIEGRIHRQSEFKTCLGETVTVDQLRAIVPPKVVAGPTEFTIIGDDLAEQEARESCLREPAEWGNDGSQFVLKLCRTCKGKGLHREGAVRIVKEILAKHTDFPRPYSDAEIGKRFDSAKIEPGKLLDPPPVLSNFEMEEKRSIPRDLADIMADFERIRLDLVVCRDELFHISGTTFTLFRRPEQLFALILANTRVLWGQGISKAEFFEAVKQKVEKVDSIEITPHFPPIEKIKYLHNIKPGPTDELERLLSLMNPSSPPDKDLLRAAICTLSWGGKAGKRPGFAILSAEEQPGKQIGTGKSSTCDLCISAHGLGQARQHTIRASRDFDQLVKHIVSPSGAGIRAIVLDNVKGTISGQDIESLMTTATISGHQMYSGYGATQNYMTWFANGNDLKLSDDVAKRLMPIKISRAAYGPDWERKVATIRWDEVVAGVGTILNSPARKMPAYTRWALWESEVLSKCTTDYKAMQDIISARQVLLSETEQFSRDLSEALDGWLSENACHCETYDGGVVLTGVDLVYIFSSISVTSVRWNPRSVARKLNELNWLDGRVQKHPNTALRRYVVSNETLTEIIAEIRASEFPK